MHYSIYIDKLWLIDFVINTYLLLLVRRTFRLKGRIGRIILCSAGNAVVFIAILALPGISPWIKLFLQAVPINLFLLQAAFSFRTKEMVVKSYACMNCYGLFLGGITLLLSGYITSGIKGITVIKILFSMAVETLAIILYQYYRKKTGKTGRLYEIKLDFYGESLCCMGFHDSGNSLYEPYKKRPVVILEKQSAGGLLKRVPPEKYYLVPFHSIGKQHGLLQAVELPAMEIFFGEERRIFHKVVVALSEEKLSGREEYQMILHPEFVRQEE